ncbi:MAG: hypothetical protein V3R58_08495 [candidate division NC10 bacterium]
MAVVYLCDGGCGEKVADTPPVGFVRQQAYCEKCMTSVLLFFEKRDQLHEKVAGSWQKGLQQLQDRFHKEHPGGVLPDE